MALITSDWSEPVGFEVGAIQTMDWEVKEMQKFLSNNPTSNYSFGYAVALNGAGDAALVSSYRDGALLKGSVFYFVKTNGIWTFVNSFTSGEGIARTAGFGISLAMSADGKTALVGTNSDTQEFYHYALEAGIWQPKSRESPPSTTIAGGVTATDVFGASIALSADGLTAFVGDYNAAVNGHAGVGVVFVYTYISNAWRFQKMFLPPVIAASAGFGIGIALSGDGLHAAISNRGIGDHGYIHIFTRSGTTWTRVENAFFDGEFYTATITAVSVTTKYFGNKLALNYDGGLLYAGFRTDPAIVSDGGGVVVFTRDHTGEYREVQRIYSSDIAASDNFGYAIATNHAGDVLLATAPFDDDGGSATGSAYYFDTSALLDRLNNTGYFTASDKAANDYFGSSVCLSSDGLIALVGSPNDDDQTSNAGAVYYFTKVAGVWTQRSRWTSTDSGAQDNFGSSIAMNSSGDIAAIGQQRDDDKAGDAGAVWIFTRVGDVWTQQQKLIPPTINGWDWSNNLFGSAVALNADGTELLVGVSDAGGMNGAIVAFRKVGGVFTYYARLSLGTTFGSKFGSSVCLSADGTKAIVGAPRSDIKNNNAGCAYLCTRYGDVWMISATFYPSDLIDDDSFGASCSCTDDFSMIAVGAPGLSAAGLTGSVYLYTVEGTTLTLRRKVKAYSNSILVGGIMPSAFGSSVSLSGNGKYMLAGANKADVNYLDTGAVITFASLNQ